MSDGKPSMMNQSSDVKLGPYEIFSTVRSIVFNTNHLVNNELSVSELIEEIGQETTYNDNVRAKITEITERSKRTTERPIMFSQ